MSDVATATTEATKRQVFHDAIELLVDRAVIAGQPANPGAYAAKVRSTLNQDLRPMARDLFELHPDIDAATLAERLAAGEAKPTPSPSPAHFDRRSVCGTCGCTGGGGWLPAERDANGVVGDVTPCPTCSVDRHRAHHFEADARSELHAKYAATIARHREDA